MPGEISNCQTEAVVIRSCILDLNGKRERYPIVKGELTHELY
jgi:hypothetical protein